MLCYGPNSPKSKHRLQDVAVASEINMRAVFAQTAAMVRSVVEMSFRSGMVSYSKANQSQVWNVRTCSYHI